MKVAISSIRTKDIRIDRHELIAGIQELGNEVIYLGQESADKIHSDYEKYGVDFKSIPIGRSNTNPLKEIQTIKNAKQILKENKAEALIVYGIRTFPTMVLAARLAGVKRILCIVNGSGRLFQLKGVKGFIVKLFSYPMLWLSFLLTNNLLFQNPDDMKMVKQKRLLWRRNYGVINGSGVNIDKYKFEPLVKEPNFLMISRLTGSKGVNEYIQAANQVKKNYPEANFYLIGPMDDNDSTINISELKKAVENGTITMKGKVLDVRPYINKCRVFVLPSYYPEGVPRSILEAMAMGRPIITTNSPGCKETVEDSRNGFLVPPRDSLTLSEKMQWLIEHDIKTEEMGQESRKMAVEKFDINKINETILNIMSNQS